MPLTHTDTERIYGNWTSSYYTTTTATVTSNSNSTFEGWVQYDLNSTDSTPTTAAIYTTAIYTTWVDEAYSTPSATQENYRIRNVIPRETPAEREARIERQKKVRKERELRARLRKMAERRAKKEIERRAKELLESILTPEELEGYRKHGSVRIRGQHGIYDVGSGWSGMIFMLDHDGEPKYKLCCHPSFNYPTADRIAAVVLALKADEEGVLARANRHMFSEMDRRRVKAWRGHRRKYAANGLEYVGTGVQIERVA
jgi:hypothetical protein